MSSHVLDRLLELMQGSRGIPAAEHSVVSVLGALDSEDVGRQSVIRHIAADFSLTQRVLKLANSAMYAPFGVGVASVSAALNILDPEALTHLMLSTDLISEDELKQDGDLSRTLFASALARQALSERSEEASIATLMFHIGQLMVGKYLPDDASTIARLTALGVDPQEASAEVLGMSFQEIGVEMATRWNLPNQILSTLQGNGDKALVSISRFSCKASALVFDGKADQVAGLIQALDLPGVDKSALQQLIVQKSEDIQRLNTAAISKSSRPTASQTDLRSAIQQEKGRVIDNLAASLLPLCTNTLQSTRCLLFMLTRSGEFRIRAGHGPLADELQKVLKVSAEYSPTAFHLAIRNKAEIVIREAGRLKPSALPAEFRARLPAVQQIVLLPIAHSQTSGLLYCDWETPVELGPAMLESARKLRDLFNPFFP